MKKGMVMILAIALFFISLSSAFALTEYTELIIGESYQIKDKNITLIGISSDEESLIVCVNNQKEILSNDKTINEIGLHIRDTNKTSASLKITYKCPNCICSSECSNKFCVGDKKEEKPTKTSKEKEVNGSSEKSIEQITAESIKKIKIVNENPVILKPSQNYFVIIALILLAFMLILYILKPKDKTIQMNKESKIEIVKE